MSEMDLKSVDLAMREFRRLHPSKARAREDKLQLAHEPCRADDGRDAFNEGYCLGWIDGVDKIAAGEQAAWDFSGSKQIATERVARDLAEQAQKET